MALIDLQRLASVLMTSGAKLWTLEKRLARQAEHFGVVYHTPSTAN
ncbi:hypothetical protein JWZ98_03535 [Methylomonas sp. EFPC1]|nr:hypothetical protein [Methylomonas sp. EFPC1]QSB02046.1 hypothetical protein JWZ98_03535 [Methylomonas sp. EFPC1]